MLIEAGPRVLAGFPEDLSAYAQRSLEELGVEVVLGKPVTECAIDGVVYGGKRLAARTIDLGRRRAGLARGANGSTRRPTAPAACRSSPI